MGLFLLISSAFLHALWNSWVKASPKKEPYLAVVVSLAAVFSWVGFMLSGNPVTGGTAFKIAILSGFFEGIYLMVLGTTLKVASLSWAYAVMRGCAMIFVWVVSITFFEEKLTLIGFSGALLIFAGLWMPVLGAPEVRRDRKAILLPILCSICIAGYHICYDEALKLSITPDFLFATALTISVPFSLLNLWLRKDLKVYRQIFKSNPLRTALAGIVVYSSFMLFLYGLQYTAPGFAITLRNTSIFFALLLGLRLGERIGPYQVATCVLIFLGAMLMGLD